MRLPAAEPDGTPIVTTTLRIWIARSRTTGWAIAEQFAGPLAQFVLTPFLLAFAKAASMSMPQRPAISGLRVCNLPTTIGDLFR